MSYDVSIGDQSFNYTSNGSAIFYDHIPECESRGGLHELNGKTGRRACEIIQAALDGIDRTRCENWSHNEVGDRTFCARYDSPNGWGSTVGALLFLSKILAACAANPRKKVRVCA